jgi:hypothetical protein
MKEAAGVNNLEYSRFVVSAKKRRNEGLFSRRPNVFNKEFIKRPRGESGRLIRTHTRVKTAGTRDRSRHFVEAGVARFGRPGGGRGGVR